MLTVTLSHIGFDDIVPNKFKVRVTDPVRDGGPGASKEVVEDSYFMSKEHEAIHEVGAHKTSTAGDEDALPLGRG